VEEGFMTEKVGLALAELVIFLGHRMGELHWTGWERKRLLALIDGVQEAEREDDEHVAPRAPE
jgi:hypothetical protein